MKAVLVLIGVVALFFTGCATHSPKQIAAVRAAGVSSRVVAKLEHERTLTPEDLIELRRRRVSDSVAIRHLDDVGVDYVVQRNDITKLRKAGVRPGVIEELIRASDRFYEDRTRPSRWSVGIYTPYDPWYGYHGPAGYGYGWPYYYY